MDNDIQVKWKYSEMCTFQDEWYYTYIITVYISNDREIMVQ